MNLLEYNSKVSEFIESNGKIVSMTRKGLRLELKTSKRKIIKLSLIDSIKYDAFIKFGKKSERMRAKLLFKQKARSDATGKNNVLESRGS